MMLVKGYEALLQSLQPVIFKIAFSRCGKCLLAEVLLQEYTNTTNREGSVKRLSQEITNFNTGNFRQELSRQHSYPGLLSSKY